MWRLFNPDNRLMQVVSKIADLILLSVVWLVLCCSIIGFGPASTALYYTVVKCIRRERGSACKEFFHSIRESWKTSLLVGLLLTVFGVSIVFLDIPRIVHFFRDGASGSIFRTGLSIFKILLFLGIWMYAFPMISRFQVSVPNAVINSVVLSIRNFHRTLLMLLILLVCGLITERLLFLICVVPGLVTLLFSFILEPVLKKMMPEEQKQGNSQEDQWYLE